MKTNIENLKKLRKITKIGILECKKALIKSKNNLNLAVKYLLEENDDNIKNYYENSNLSKGSIFSEISNDKKYGVILKINSETDFVSNNLEFKNFGNKILSFCIKNKINNFDLIKKTFKKDINNLILKVKENISLNEFFFINDEYVQKYIYRSKIGVIISFNNKVDFNLVKQISMHIIFNKPLYLLESEIPKIVIDKEINNIKKIIKENNKNIEKDLLEYKIKKNIEKFIEKFVLTKQKFLIDTNKIIGDILLKNNIVINKFKILEL